MKKELGLDWIGLVWFVSVISLYRVLRASALYLLLCSGQEKGWPEGACFFFSSFCLFFFFFFLFLSFSKVRRGHFIF